MDAIQSSSKLSGYTINWNKSEAIPLSKFCLPFMVDNFNFKWVHKGLKYLDIKLSQDVGEIAMLNFNGEKLAL